MVGRWATTRTPSASVILATTNGGATWTRRARARSPTGAELYGVACANASDAWAAGEDMAGSEGSGASVILATTNGGSGGVTTPQLTLKLSGLKSGAIQARQRLTAKGTVTPHAWSAARSPSPCSARSRQVRKVKSLRCTIAASGTYSCKYKPARKGGYRLRATIAKTDANTAAATKWLRFRVK